MMERIKNTKDYKGNDDGFARLCAAIWQKAVGDELKHQMAKLLMDTSESLFSALLKYDRQDRNTYSKVSRLVGDESEEAEKALGGDKSK